MPPKVELKTAIIDYAMGNLFSVYQACLKVGLTPKITSDHKEIMAADALILPGVGAFGDAMLNLKKFDLINPIKDFVAQGKHFLGICLGMQLLFTKSEEFGEHQGLDIIPGEVIKFPVKTREGLVLKVPQIGWNQISAKDQKKWDASALHDIANGEYMYFVHSYYAVPQKESDILTLTNYEGVIYCSSIQRNKIFASQFHPEKSAEMGLKIYSNWAQSIKNMKAEN